MLARILSILLIIGFGISTASQLDEYLQAQLSEYKRFDYEVVRMPRNIKSFSDERVSILHDKNIRISNGYAYVPIEVIFKNNVTTKSVATLKISLYQDVYVAIRKIKRGEELSKGDFFVMEKNVAQTIGAPIKLDEQLNNMRASTNIKQDLVLLESMIERKPIVNRGDRVTAYVSVGNVTISFMANAREEGYKGKRIRIVRDDDKRIFKAEILDPKNVKIIE